MKILTTLSSMANRPWDFMIIAPTAALRLNYRRYARQDLAEKAIDEYLTDQGETS